MGGCTAAVQSCVGKRRLIITMKDLAKKAAKNRRMVTFSQLMGCLGSGACAAAVGTACVHAGVFTAGTACLAAAGVMGTLGCADAVKSCVGRSPCASAFTQACGTEGDVILGSGCLAPGQYLETIGCADAVKSCVGKRRLIITI